MHESTRNPDFSFHGRTTERTTPSWTLEVNSSGSETYLPEGSRTQGLCLVALCLGHWRV